MSIHLRKCMNIDVKLYFRDVYLHQKHTLNTTKDCSAFNTNAYQDSWWSSLSQWLMIYGENKEHSVVIKNDYQ